MRAARRHSVNRPRGTLVPHCLNITQEVYHQFMLEKVLPAIKEKCPVGMRGSRTIRIQKDNAKPHVQFTTSLPDLVAKSTELGIDVQPYFQPANSPDLNVLDLSLFRAFQTQELKQYADNTMELISATERAFQEYPYGKIDDAFLTLQYCMNEIIKVDGGNSYSLPPIGKQRLRSLGNLPVSIAAEIEGHYFERADEE
jgi:hypothetical protein